MSVLTGVGFDELLRDTRHLDARAASDLADWLVHLDLEGKADRTLYVYARQVAPLLRDFPDKTVGEFTHTDVNEVLRRIPPRSRHITRSIYGKFFEWAYVDERVERNPMDKVPRMRQPHRRPKDIFSPEEVALLSGLPSPDGPLFAILFGTGLRKSEATNLRREHVDLERSRLIVYHGKGDKDRIIPLTADAAAAVADLDLFERLERPDHLWYSRPGGRRIARRDPICGTTFSRWFEKALTGAGIRYLNPHQTRHTYGHLMRELGLDLEERQLLMGHESIRTTQHYYGTLTIDDVARRIGELESRA